MNKNITFYKKINFPFCKVVKHFFDTNTSLRLTYFLMLLSSYYLFLIIKRKKLIEKMFFLHKKKLGSEKFLS